MIKRMIIMFVACAVVIGAIFGYKAFGHMMMMKYMGAMSNPTFTVSSVKATKQDWQQEIKAVGTLRAAKGADLAPEVAGTVDNIFMESGQDVTEGTVLLQMHSAEDYAKLQALVASTRLAELNVKRDEKQIKAQAISQAAFDADVATLENLKAQMEAQKALLEKKTLTAPFSGRLGIRKVDVGQYLTPGAAIVTLQQLDPIYLDFFVPQQSLSQLQIGQKIIATTDAAEGKSFEGELTAIEAKVDEATRNIGVRAVFKNPEKILRPGMFATATISSGEPQNLITLPQTAITFNPYGSTVYIIKPNGTDDKGAPKLVANMVFVETGLTRGDQIAVLKGVNEDDEVVTAGQLKLRNGANVAINNTVVPKNDANPLPADK